METKNDKPITRKKISLDFTKWNKNNLHKRTVTYSTLYTTVSKILTKGQSQDSVLGLFIWNVVMDSLLQNNWPAQNVIAYVKFRVKQILNILQKLYTKNISALEGISAIVLKDCALELVSALPDVLQVSQEMFKISSHKLSFNPNNLMEKSVNAQFHVT